MGKASRSKRLSAAQTEPPEVASETTPPRAAHHRFTALVIAVLVATGWAAAPRFLNPTPRSYDEYYHLGVTRLIAEHGFRDSYAGAPTLGDRWVDGAPLFHLVELPFSGLSLGSAGLAVSLLCLALLFAAAAAFLWQLDRRRAPFYVLVLLALGPLFAYRLSMARPQVLLLAFSTLSLALLCVRREPESRRTLALLAAVSAAAGLAHTGGWLAIAFAAAAAVVGWIVGSPTVWRWKPTAAVAFGWLGGQLLHPQVPGNFDLHWRSGFVIPFQASGAGSQELAAVIGAELTPLSTAQIGQQLLAFVPALLAAWFLLARPKTRTPTVVLLTGLAIAFLAVGAFKFQRVFELGVPLGVFALAAAAGSADSGSNRRGKPWKAIAATLLVIAGAAWSQLAAIAQTPPVSPPLEMARFLATQASAGDRVFTAQWGDSAPLLYFAPQAQSLVALDPTVLWLEDPELFDSTSGLHTARRRSR